VNFSRLTEQVQVITAQESDAEIGHGVKRSISEKIAEKYHSILKTNQVSEKIREPKRGQEAPFQQDGASCDIANLLKTKLAESNGEPIHATSL
jgi:hypothetical protein